MTPIISSLRHGLLRAYNALAELVGMAHYSRGIVLVRPRRAGLIGGVGGQERANGNGHGPSGDGMRKRVPNGEAEKQANGGPEEGESIAKWIEERVPSLQGTFKPSWWLPSGHLQTAYIVAGNFTKVDQVEYERTLLQLPDGGTIGLDITPPSHASLPPDAPTVIIAHGLTGGSHESYVRNVLAWVIKPKSEGGLGGRGVVSNYRGCASTPLTSPQFYSAGYTGDYATAVAYIAAAYPDSPLVGMGFSLGASVVARYMGEQGEGCVLRAGMVLGCPWDIPTMSKTLETGFISSRIYSSAMGHNLIKVMQRNIAPIRAEFSDHPDPAMVRTVEAVDALAARGRSLRLKDVDEHLTCQLGGLRQEKGGVFPFAGADGYYEWASSKGFIPRVRRPLLGVNAFDDPIIDGASLPLDLVQDSSHVVLAVTGGGGHLGWFDGPLFASRHGYPQQRWVLQPVKEYVTAAVEDERLDTRAVRRGTQQGDAGWVWADEREGDLYGRIGWKVVEAHRRVDGQEGSGALQGL